VYVNDTGYYHACSELLIQNGNCALISMLDRSAIRGFSRWGAVWLALVTLTCAQSPADQHVKVE
jgi:hypothetical protein